MMPQCFRLRIRLVNGYGPDYLVVAWREYGTTLRPVVVQVGSAADPASQAVSLTDEDGPWRVVTGED